MGFPRALASVLALVVCVPALGAGSFANFESPPVHPLEMTPDGTRLLAANTADGRLEVFTITSGKPVYLTSIPVGIDPVTVRARSNTEAWVVNKLSDDVSIVNLTTLNVVATISVGDEPADVVFAGAPQRAYVSVAGLNQIRIYDPTNLAAAPVIVPIAGHEPRALTTDGTRVFAAIFFAGNRSMVVPPSIVNQPDGPEQGQNPPYNAGNAFNPPLAPGLPTPPPTSLLINRETTPQGERWKDDNGGIWDAKISWGLNQNAIAVIPIANPAGITYIQNIGNLQMSVAVQPGTGRLTVTQVYLHNESRFESQTLRQFGRQRMAFFNISGSATSGISDMNPQLMVSPPLAIYKTSVTPAERNSSVGDPRAHVWNSTGSAAYVSGMDSNNVIKISITNSPQAVQRLATIDVGQGPTGLALDEPRNRLYVLNRFDGNLTTIDTTSNAEITPRVAFYDPTPAVIKTGRPVLYGSHNFSALGQVSCASCHVDARSDMQAWDLGDPSGAMKSFNQTCFGGISPPGTCNDWHPMKGPMVTQTLAGIIGSEPLHWRGDREDITAFSVGFTGLLGMAAPPVTQQLQDMGGFLATVLFPPNPNRTLTNGLPNSLSAPYIGNPQNGQALFNTPILNNNSVSCTTCHSLPSGGNTQIVSPALLSDSQGIKIPHLRDLYKKTGFSYASTLNDRAFGYLHDGRADNTYNLLANHIYPIAPGAPGDGQRADLEAYLMCFDPGTHAAVGVQVTVDGTNNNSPAVTNLLGTLTAVADTGAIGLVAKGVVGGIPRGYVYLPGTGMFQTDRKPQKIDAVALRQSAIVGGEITFTAVVAGTQTRIGVDRDEDGFYDRDELDLGSNPADASSQPFPRGDMDHDHFVTLLDVPTFVGVMLNPGGATAQQQAQADMNADGIVDGNDLQLFVNAILGG